MKHKINFTGFLENETENLLLFSEGEKLNNNHGGCQNCWTRPAFL